MQWGICGATLALACLASACGDDGGGAGGGASTGGGAGGEAPSTSSTTTSGQGGAGGAPEPEPVELHWYACPWITGKNAECAKPSIPLDWDDPTGPRIDYFVKRVPAAVQPARGQLWILQGGPGGSGTSIEFLARYIEQEVDDLDLYIPDHRGTGLSSRLDCPALDLPPTTTRPLDPDELAPIAQACVEALLDEHGEGLGRFSSADAARDLGELIALSRTPDQDVYLYGVSYGTRWLHRYLQQFPAQASGVVFDSIGGEGYGWLDFDAEYDEVARALLDECGADAFCAGKLGSDPEAFLLALIADLEAGHCPTSEDLDVHDYKAFFASFLSGGLAARHYLPALVYRVARCDETDQEVVLRLRAQREPTAAPDFSGALHFNVVAGDLVEPDAIGVDEAWEEQEQLLVSTVQVPAYAAVHEVWPHYDPGPLHGTYADTSTPILMLQAPLDAQTTIGPATEFASHYEGEHQTYVVIPGGAHGLVNSSPLADGGHCGVRLLAQFVADPTSAIDAACATQVLPADFERRGEGFGVGTVNLWENGPTAAPVVDVTATLWSDVHGGVR